MPHRVGSAARGAIGGAAAGFGVGGPIGAAIGGGLGLLGGLFGAGKGPEDIERERQERIRILRQRFLQAQARLIGISEAQRRGGEEKANLAAERQSRALGRTGQAGVFARPQIAEIRRAATQRRTALLGEIERRALGAEEAFAGRPIEVGASLGEIIGEVGPAFGQVAGQFRQQQALEDILGGEGGEVPGFAESAGRAQGDFLQTPGAPRLQLGQPLAELQASLAERRRLLSPRGEVTVGPLEFAPGAQGGLAGTPIPRRFGALRRRTGRR